MDYKSFTAHPLPNKAQIQKAIEILETDVLETLRDRVKQSVEDLNATKSLGHELEAQQFARLRDRVMEAITMLKSQVKPEKLGDRDCVG